MKYTHWAGAPVTLDRTRTYDQNLRSNMKPCGLWLSVDGDWERWCEDEGGFGSDRRIVAHSVEFTAKRVLHLVNPYDMDKFTELYTNAELERELGLARFGLFINWHRVAEEHAGIVIAPYQWRRRLHDATTWYYGWDCASGCIWDLSVITKFQAL